MSNELPPVYIHKNDQGNTNYNIEPNHTHFLLFDHNPSDLDVIIKRRHDIEYKLSRKLKSGALGHDTWNSMHEQIACRQSSQISYNILFQDLTMIIQ